jgi:hypothetical protein
MPSSSRRSRRRRSRRRRSRHSHGSPRSRGRRIRAEMKKQAETQQLAALALVNTSKYAEVWNMGYEYGHYTGVRNIRRNVDDSWSMYLQIAPTGIIDKYSKLVFEIAFEQGLHWGNEWRNEHWCS